MLSKSEASAGSIRSPAESTASPTSGASAASAVESALRVFRARDHKFSLGRKTYIMGILNVTPDSFSDGGRFFKLDDALRQVEKLIAGGADIIDIGGESTRPGFSPVSAEEETARIVPIIVAISERFPTAISIDTTKASTAAAAIEAGASIINDISGLRTDAEMAGVVARSDAGAVLMFHAGLPSELLIEHERELDRADWGSRMKRYLKVSLDLAVQAGVNQENLLLDPGVGFSMTSEESIEIFRNSHVLAEFGLPVLHGTSRKRLISHILGERSVDQRLLGTAATVCYSIVSGADFVRVHDVAEIADVTRVMDALWRKGGN